MPKLAVNGTELHYLDEGPRDAPVVVCSPSMFFDVDMFSAQAAALSDRYRVVRYDHRGQGGSARAPREQLDMDTLSEDAASLIEALHAAPCTFVGNSMGGFIALRLAARRPDLIRSIVVMGSSADEEEQSDSMDQLVDAMLEQGIEPVLDGVLYFMLGDTTLSDPSRSETLAAVKSMLLTRTPEYAHAAWNIAHRKPVLDELASIDCPTLVVAGTEDHTYPPPKSEQIARLIPHAKLEYMERTGHVHAVESPEAVHALLEAHLRELAPR